MTFRHQQQHQNQQQHTTKHPTIYTQCHTITPRSLLLLSTPQVQGTTTRGAQHIAALQGARTAKKAADWSDDDSDGGDDENASAVEVARVHARAFEPPTGRGARRAGGTEPSAVVGRRKTVRGGRGRRGAGRGRGSEESSDYGGSDDDWSAGVLVCCSESIEWVCLQHGLLKYLPVSQMRALWQAPGPPCMHCTPYAVLGGRGGVSAVHGLNTPHCHSPVTRLPISVFECTPRECDCLGAEHATPLRQHAHVSTVLISHHSLLANCAPQDPPHPTRTVMD